RAQIYAEQGRADLALADYTRALSLNPAYTPAYRHRARLLIRAGRTGEALADCEQALRLEPESAPAHTIREIALLYPRGTRRFRGKLHRGDSFGPKKCPGLLPPWPGPRQTEGPGRGAQRPDRIVAPGTGKWSRLCRPGDRAQDGQPA